MNDTKYVNKDTLAEALGVSLPTVGQFIKEGLPVLSEGSNGKEYRINPSLAIHWFAGRQAAKDHQLAATTATERAALGYALMLSLPDDGTREEIERDRRYVLNRSHRNLKQCGIEISKEEWVFMVARWLGEIGKRPSRR